MHLRRKMIADRLIRAAAALLLSATGALGAEPGPACREIPFEGVRHSVCEVSAGADLRLFLRDETGATLGSFSRIDQSLAAEGRALRFAMNAGMYHSDRSPVGLHIEGGREITPIVTASGPGNFGMTPNGVFCITQSGALEIHESRSFAKSRPDCRFATQSGPLLLIDGALHPRFLADSTSRYIRNGVGVSADGSRAFFVISGGRVSFHEFARFFRDALGLQQALYFDGNISRLYAPDLGRNDFGFAMGPVIGLVGPRD